MHCTYSKYRAQLSFITSEYLVTSKASIMLLGRLTCQHRQTFRSETVKDKSFYGELSCEIMDYD